MRSGSSELLLEQQQQELRLRKKRELAPKKKNGNRRFRSWRERVKFYGTSTLAFFSVTAGASLLFLVPLYVDPAISTLSHDFIDSPTLCTTVRREDLIGIFNCSWSSCREGCTSDLYKCIHIYVTFIEQNITIPENMTDFSNFTAEMEQSAVESTLLVNIKGCGYPPTVTCKDFNKFYGIEGAIYPCYYSRKNKTVVLTSYNHEDQVGVIVNFFFVPFIITVVSSIALCIMHCDCTCKKDRSHRRNRQPQCRRPRIENLRPFLPLPKPFEVDGPRLHLSRYGCVNPKEFSVLDILRLQSQIFDIQLFEDDNIFIAGVENIVDLSNLSLTLVKQLDPVLIKKITTFANKAAPFRVKGVHVINGPKEVVPIFNFFRKLMPKKITERIILHESLESLYQKIPREYLPKEYGGNNGCIEDITNQWKASLQKYKEFFEEDIKYGTDEKLREGFQKNFESVFGVQGSFRKLDVD